MIKAYCNEKIKVKRAKPPGDWLEPEDPAEENVYAYVDWTNELVRNISGEQVVSAVRVLMEYDSELNYDDVLVIQDRPHSIIKIARRQDFSAVLLEVWCS
jgi:hypothetical protein